MDAQIISLVSLALNGLVTIVVFLLGVLIRQRDAQVKRLCDDTYAIAMDVKELMQHRQGCIMQFADRAANSETHRRTWEAIEALNKITHGHGIEIEALKRETRYD